MQRDAPVNTIHGEATVVQVRRDGRVAVRYPDGRRRWLTPEQVSDRLVPTDQQPPTTDPQAPATDPQAPATSADELLRLLGELREAIDRVEASLNG